MRSPQTGQIAAIDIAPPPAPLSLRSIFLIVIFGASLLCVGLTGKTRVLTYHEVLFVQPAREMLNTGDWIIPRIVGVPDTHKPPLTSWLIALAIKLLGNDSEWVVRLPSVLASLATALMIAGMTARWFGNRAGLFAGLAQLTTYSTLMLGRLAEADSVLVATVCAAMSVFAWAHVDSPHGRRSDRWLPWLFYLAVDLCFLAKGLIGLAFIFSGTGLFMLVQRDFRVLRFFFNPIGLMIFVGGTLAWPVAAYCAYPQFLGDQIAHHFGRFRGAMGQSEPIYAYLYGVPLCVLPWTPLALLGFLVRRDHAWLRGALLRFFLCWMIPGLVLLTASAWRHKHYAAPLLPPLSVCAALGLVSYLEYRIRRPLLVPALRIVPVLVASSGAVVLVLLLKPRGYEPIACLAMLAGVLFAGALYFEYRRRATLQLATSYLTLWVLAAGTFTWVMPYHDSYRNQTQFAGVVNEELPKGATLYLVSVPESQITYYLKPPLARLDDPDGFLTGTRSNADELYVLAPEFVMKGFEESGQIEILRRYARTPAPIDQLIFARFQPFHRSD